MAVTYEELVLRLVQGRVFVTIREMATITGFREQSIRNWRCAGKWQIPSEKRGGRVYTSTPVFIEALESGILWALRGKRGRPRKNAVTDVAVARAASTKGIVKRLSEQAGISAGQERSLRIAFRSGAAEGPVSMDEASSVAKLGR